MATSNSNGKKLVPAVGYLRKSTKKDDYEKSIADQKARIKKMKPAEEGPQYEIIRWYCDPGIQGWKRGHKRPDYFRMVNEVRERRDVQAVLVDDMDRFSRADPMETVSDVQALRELGVRYIHAANQGVKDLARDVAMVAMKIAMEANASHEHCTRLSRRITATRRDAAINGKRTGGTAPYALALDGNGGLKHGDPKLIKIVLWLFDEFANHARSMGWITGDLNGRKVPGPFGGRWYVKTVATLLRQRAYRGDFVFNLDPSGQFFHIDSKGEVVEAAELNGAKGKVFTKVGAYKPLVDAATFDKAQRRLDLLTKDRSRRKRMGYALSGVLVCDRCGSAMYATRPKGPGTPTVYRCGRNWSQGRQACGKWQVREDAILPFVLRTLGREIADLKSLFTAPPDELRWPHKDRNEHREQNEREREKLAAQISKAEENLLFVDDARTRASLDARVSAMRDELERLDAELATEVEPQSNGYTNDDVDALTAWWDAFNIKAVSVPVSAEKNLALVGGLMQDREADESAILADPRVVNEALHQIGAEVRLRWETEAYKTSGGVDRRRHLLVRGRFRLGQQSGKLPRYVLKPPACRAPGRRASS